MKVTVVEVKYIQCNLWLFYGDKCCRELKYIVKQHIGELEKEAIGRWQLWRGDYFVEVPR